MHDCNRKGATNTTKEGDGTQPIHASTFTSAVIAGAGAHPKIIMKESSLQRTTSLDNHAVYSGY